MATGETADPIDSLILAHERQLGLCSMLEEIADGLPDQFDRGKCTRAAQMLRDDLAVLQADEELGLFPLLHTHCREIPELVRSLERLKHEHMEDQGFADEIIEALDSLVRGVPHHAAETFAYMLRGFFESFRRHSAYEKDVILPAAKRCLTQEQKQSLRDVMQANRSEDVTRLFPEMSCVSAKAAILRALGGRAGVERATRFRLPGEDAPDPESTRGAGRRVQ